MDIVKALRELYNEKKRLDAAIALLEARKKAGVIPTTTKNGKGRRGRKTMSSAERQEVSKRMTLYWEARRAKLEATAPTEDQQTSSSAAS
jgi:hypothetical protein